MPLNSGFIRVAGSSNTVFCTSCKVCGGTRSFPSKAAPQWRQAKVTRASISSRFELATTSWWSHGTWRKPTSPELSRFSPSIGPPLKNRSCKHLLETLVVDSIFLQSAGLSSNVDDYGMVKKCVGEGVWLRTLMVRRLDFGDRFEKILIGIVTRRCSQIQLAHGVVVLFLFSA